VMRVLYPLPPLISLSLSFHYSRHHRHLHSFPTRRSSDLATRSADRRRLLGTRCHPQRHAASRRGSPDPSRRRATALRLPPVGVRSEEHTSELQSRFDLVCRLLLEKKKKIYNL